MPEIWSQYRFGQPIHIHPAFNYQLQNTTVGSLSEYEASVIIMAAQYLYTVCPRLGRME